MNPTRSSLLALVLVVAGGASVALAQASPVPASSSPPRASAAPGDAVSAAAAIDAFGLDLYRVAAPGQTNLVFSPASISLALGMARAGARGATATEMDAVMHGAASDDHAGWLNALDQALASRNGSFADGDGKLLPVALRIANAPFAQQGLALEPAYLDALASRFGASLQLVDYETATEAARQTINSWVSGQTEGRIPDLLAPGVLTNLTRLSLVDAVYLKAPWQTPFTVSATTTGTFTRGDGTTTQVPFMNATQSLPYAEGAGWRAVEIPYLGGSLAMTIILPDDLASFEQTLDTGQLAAITGALAGQQVALALPRFDIETRTDLARVLAALGMPSAFSADADFSGISAAERLSISNVIHQADITVDEAGTEATAATAAVMGITALPADRVVMRVDRPFLFALRDVPTGAVLFLGRVGDPSVGR